MRCAVILVLTLSCASVHAEQTAAERVQVEGLRLVESVNFEAAAIRPGVDFSQYRKLLHVEPRLTYKRPEGAKQEFPLSREQRQQFKALVDRTLQTALREHSQLELVQDPGSQTLELDVHVQHIIARLSNKSVGRSGLSGRAQLGLVANADATLVVELRDSQSGELLAKATQSETTEGTAMFVGGRPEGRFEDSEKIAKQWAEVIAEGATNLVRR